MPNWQAELEQLLATLDVTIDHGLVAQPTQHGVRAKPVSRMVDDVEPAPSTEVSGGQETAPVDGDEVSAVRHEIEATVRRVIAMTEAGMLEAAVRDDVLFVLQALTRPQPRRARRPVSPADSSGEWQLTSAAAVLHFCRIVLRLTQAIEAVDC